MKPAKKHSLNKKGPATTPASPLHLTDDVLKAIRQITQAIDLHSRHLEKSHGITGPQLLLLREIQQHQPMTISELAQAVSLSVSTVTGILMRLEKKGFLQRSKCSQDKRRVLIEPTSKCADFLKKAPQPLQNRFIENFSNLAQWEQLMILSSLQRLVSLMSAEDIDVSPILASGPIHHEENTENR